MGKNILEEAVEDAKRLKEVAIEQAKNTLVEALSSKLKTVVENQLGMTDMGALPSQGGVGGNPSKPQFESMDELVEKLTEMSIFGEL